MNDYEKKLDDFINDETSEKKEAISNKKYLIDNRNTIVEQIDRVVIVKDGRQLLCENI